MGERVIDPKFNIHKTYRKVNIVNPYRFDSGGGGGTTNDPDLQEVLDVAAAQSFVLPPQSTLDAIEQFIIALKDADLWDKQDSLVNLALGEGAYQNFARIDLKKKHVITIGLSSSGAGYEADGLIGNGINIYANLNLDIASLENYSRDNATIGVVVPIKSTSTSYGPNMIMSQGLGNYSRITTNDSIAIRLNSNNNSNSAPNFANAGYLMLSRNNSTQMLTINKSVQQTVNSDSTALDNSGVYLLRYRDTYGEGGVALIHHGGYMTYEESQQFRTIYNDYLESIGLTSFA